ncbi:sigma 54-interacting transcriptional regulator, partial [Escherichia coli]|nr:sigma 54-interacting transcriptional regulator [Escherichia coli]
QEIEPLGSNHVIRVDVRVIAATSRDLPRLVAEGKFREDLYYRLNVVPLRLPALRDRLADLEALVEALEDDIARRTGMPHR